MTRYSEIAQAVREKRPVKIPDGWRQGRTAYGGLTAALCLEAAKAQYPDLAPLRSMQINFTGPVKGDPLFEARLLRQGRNVTSVAVSALVDGNNVGEAQFLFGMDRDSVLNATLPTPDVGIPEACEPFAPPAAEGFLPAFFKRFETKLAGGARPMTGAKEGYVLAWSRHVEDQSREGEAEFVCLGDVLPPAAFPMMRVPVMISSMNWTLNLINPPETEEGWYLVETRLSAARAGYSSQIMRYWNRAGLLIAEGTQSVAMFG